MTGELYAVLSQHSILRHAVAADLSFDENTPAFIRAVEAALKEPVSMAESLFGVRASQLLGFEEQSDGAAHLSGLLIGSEVGRVKQLYGTGTIGLVASGELGRLYQAVLQKAGFEAILHNGETVVRQGLFAAASQLWPVADMSGSKE
jgi:2-dehydro-3-deoxygalactonokinase